MSNASARSVRESLWVASRRMGPTYPLVRRCTPGPRVGTGPSIPRRGGVTAGPRLGAVVGLRVVEAAEDDAGAGLGVEERRLLGHALAGEGDGTDLVDRDRAQQHRGRRALLDHRGDVVRVVAVHDVGRA